MHSNLSRALAQVLKHEGGYVNHPNDPGGPTNLGVTLANFKRYVKPNGTIEDLKKLTRAQAEMVFERQYWDAVRGNQLPGGLDFAVFDFAVNSGPSRAVRFLQALLGVPEDGVVGPVTLKAIENVNIISLVQRLCDKRLAWLKGLKTWSSFGKGWERRVMDVRLTASTWAAEAQKAEAPAPLPDAPIEVVPTERPVPMPTPLGFVFIVVLIVLAALGAWELFFGR